MKRGEDYIGVAAVTLCHDGNGNYLLGKRSDKCRDEHSRWDLLGSGKVEYGETLEETIVREIKEECGSDVVKIEELGYREVHRDAEQKQTHWMALDFLVEIDRDKVFNAEPEKCVELDWFKLEDFPEPMHSQWPIFLKMHKDKL